VNIRVPAASRIGEIYGCLKIISVLGDGPGTCVCECECGTVRKFFIANVVRGLSKSCGCQKSKWIGESHRKHGESHSASKATPEYMAWMGMKSRCYTKSTRSFRDYGARGVIVCKRWRNSFKNFIHDMGRRPLGYSLERKRVNGNYCPGNCSWIPMGQQALNTRRNVFIKYRGLMLTLSQWGRKIGMNPDIIADRIKAGYPIPIALSPMRLRPGSNGESRLKRSKIRGGIRLG